MRRLLWLAAPAWAAGTSALLLLAPMYSSISEHMYSSASEPILSDSLAALLSPPPVRSEIILEANGPDVLIPLLIPVLLAAVPFLVPAQRGRRFVGVVAAAPLAFFCVLGAMSIGLFYVPSVAALFAAAAGATQLSRLIM